MPPTVLGMLILLAFGVAVYLVICGVGALLPKE